MTGNVAEPQLSPRPALTVLTDMTCAVPSGDGVGGKLKILLAGM